MGFLDRDDEPAPALPVAIVDMPNDPLVRLQTFQTAWAEISDMQKRYLTAFRDTGFRRNKALALLGEQAPNASTVHRWHSNEHYAFLEKAMKNEVVNGILAKNNLAIRHNDIVEQLLEPQPILYMGAPTGFYENKAPAAAKANRDLMELAGHMKPDATIVPLVGPALIVQVVQASGEVITVQAAQPVLVNLPAPSFLEIDD